MFLFGFVIFANRLNFCFCKIVFCLCKFQHFPNEIHEHVLGLKTHGLYSFLLNYGNYEIQISIRTLKFTWNIMNGLAKFHQILSEPITVMFIGSWYPLKLTTSFYKEDFVIHQNRKEKELGMDSRACVWIFNHPFHICLFFLSPSQFTQPYLFLNLLFCLFYKFLGGMWFVSPLIPSVLSL